MNSKDDIEHDVYSTLIIQAYSIKAAIVWSLEGSPAAAQDQCNREIGNGGRWIDLLDDYKSQTSTIAIPDIFCTYEDFSCGT